MHHPEPPWTWTEAVHVGSITLLLPPVSFSVCRISDLLTTREAPRGQGEELTLQLPDWTVLTAVLCALKFILTMLQRSCWSSVGGASELRDRTRRRPARRRLLSGRCCPRPSLDAAAARRPRWT